MRLAPDAGEDQGESVMKGKVYIGTSGWNYDHWKGPFYPADLPKNKWFEYYAGKLGTVEINNSFYQLAAANTWEKWRKAAPERFVYSVKGNRYITHMKKLKDPEEGIENLISRARLLSEHLGPVLFQLPPRWKCNPERLSHFLDHLPKDIRFTFELRDESWWNEAVYSRLRRHSAAFCIFHLAGVQSPMKVTAPFVYIRLHGPGGKYEGKYDRDTLAGWAEEISQWRAAAHDVYCYFDNDQGGFAAQNALALAQLLP